MSDVTLETLNRRTAIAAVHAEAARAGLDADILLDSKAFYDQVTALDPDTQGFRAQVRNLVTSAAAAARQAAPDPAPAAETAAPRQWTMDDVTNSTPSELVKAGEAGLLVDLGYYPPRKRR